MISRQRKIELTNRCRLIFNEIPPLVRGNQSLAALVNNRICSIIQTLDEGYYCIELLGVMIAKMGTNPTISEIKCAVCGLDLNHCLCEWDVPKVELIGDKVHIKKDKEK